MKKILTHINIVFIITFFACNTNGNRISIIQSDTKLTDIVGTSISETPLYPQIYNDSVIVFQCRLVKKHT